MSAQVLKIKEKEPQYFQLNCKIEWERILTKPMELPGSIHNNRLIQQGLPGLQGHCEPWDPFVLIWIWLYVTNNESKVPALYELNKAGNLTHETMSTKRKSEVA